MKRGGLVAVLIFLCANIIFAQEKSSVIINGHFQDENLVEVLKLLKKHYGLEFAYDAELLKTKNVTKDLNGLSLEEAMQALLAQSDLEFELINETVVIKPKSFKPHQKSTFTISGIVRDNDSGESLPYTTLRILGTNIGTSANVDGLFSIVNIPSDTCSLVVNYLGYQEQVVSLSEFAENSSSLEVSMKNVASELDEVVVNDSNSKIVAVDDQISSFKLNPLKLTSLPTLGEQDIFRSLQLFPGISATNETSSGLIIRGSPSGQNLVLFDGFTLYHVDHFFGVFSAINSAAVKDIRVLKGGFDAKYGGRVSGVVDITGKSGNRNDPSMSFGLNMISANASLEVPLGNKVRLFAAGRRAYTDIIQSDLYTKLFDKVIVTNVTDGIDTDEIDPDFHFYDHNSKITFQPNNKNLLSFSMYSGKDDLNLAFSEDFEDGNVESNENNSWGNTGYGFRWARQWNDRFFTNAKAGYSNFFSDFDLDFDLEFIEDKTTFLYSENYIRKNDLNDLSFSFENELILNRHNRLEFGATFTKNKIILKDAFEGEEFQDYSEDGTQFGLYIQSTFDLFDKTSLTLGLRNNHYNVTSKNYLEPKISLNQHINTNLRLKVAWGKNHQAIVRIFDSDVFNNAPDFWYMADEDVVPVSSSQHFSGGFVFENDGWLLDIETFHKKTEGVVEFLTILEDFGDGQTTSDVFVVGSSVSKGLDLLVSKNVGHYNGWISYTLGKVENEFPGLNRSFAYPSSFDQRHELKIVNTFTAGKWDLSSTWVYGSGRPYSSPQDVTANLVTDSLNVDYVAVDHINARRLPSYHRLDLSATYNLKIGASKAQVGMSLYNAYGRRNIKNKRFTQVGLDSSGNNQGDADTEYVVSDVILLGFTPNIFLNIRF